MWLFQMKLVGARLVGKTAGKKGEPPSGLPIEMPFYAAASPAGGAAEPAAPSAPAGAGRPAPRPASGAAPINLPLPEELGATSASASAVQPIGTERRGTPVETAPAGPGEPPGNLPLA